MDLTRFFGLLLSIWAVWWQPGPAHLQTPNACTGYAWSDYLATAPGPIRQFNGAFLYQWERATYPGDPYLNLVGNLLIQHNVITAQAYTQDLPTARAWIRTGPLLVAGRWPGSTYDHAWILYAYAPSRGLWRYQNSLPPYYGYQTDAQLAGLWFGTATKAGP